MGIGAVVFITVIKTTTLIANHFVMRHDDEVVHACYSLARETYSLFRVSTLTNSPV
jgi:hypothetical protein